MLTVSDITNRYHGIHHEFTIVAEKPIIEEGHKTPLTRAADEILAHGGLVNMDEEYQREFVNKFAGGKWPPHFKHVKRKNDVVEISNDLEPIVTNSENIYELFKKSLSGINPYTLYRSFGISQPRFAKLHFTRRFYKIKDVRTGRTVESNGLKSVCDLAKRELGLPLSRPQVSYCLWRSEGNIIVQNCVIAIATRIRKIRRVILKKQ